MINSSFGSNHIDNSAFILDDSWLKNLNNHILTQQMQEMYDKLMKKWVSSAEIGTFMDLQANHLLWEWAKVPHTQENIDLFVKDFTDAYNSDTWKQIRIDEANLSGEWKTILQNFRDDWILNKVWTWLYVLSWTAILASWLSHWMWNISFHDKTSDFVTINEWIKSPGILSTIASKFLETVNYILESTTTSAYGWELSGVWIIARIWSSWDINTYNNSLDEIPESVISKAQKMQADKSIEYAVSEISGWKWLYVIRKADKEVTISYEWSDYNTKFAKSSVNRNFDLSGGRIAVTSDNNTTTTFRGRTWINAVAEKDPTKSQTMWDIMSDKLTDWKTNLNSIGDEQKLWPVSAGINYEKKDNYSFDIWIIQDINNIKNDTQLKWAYRVLYAAGKMWAYIWVEKWSEFEKFVISNDIKIEWGKVRVSASLIDKLMNVNVAELNKSFEAKMKQKALWVEYTKYLTEFNEKWEWINKKDLLKEISTSINFFTAWNQDLWRVWAIIQETNAYFDQTWVYAWVAWGSALVAESKFVWMLSNNLRLDTTLWVDYNMQNSMYDQSANSKLTPVYGAEARYKISESNTIYGGYKHTANADEYKWWIETKITDEIKTFVEANRFNYNDPNIETSNWVMVWLKYTWWWDKSNTALYTPTKPGDKLTLWELNPIAAIDSRNIRVKTRIVIFKDHEAFIDKTVFAAGDWIDKNLDGSLKDIYFDNGWFTVQSINQVSDSRYSPFITVVAGKLAITNIVGLNNQMKAEWLASGSIKNIRVSVVDTSGLSLYDINLTKWSVELIATVDRVFTVTPAQAQAFVAGSKTLDQIEAEIIAAQDHINPVATWETLATAYNTALNNIDVLANDTDNSWTVTLWNNITNQVGGTFTKIWNKINFTPNNNFTWQASCTYPVLDPAGNTSTAVLTVNVAAQEVVPVMWNVPNQA
ncbi:MAG: hypothetical protein ACD_49C00001G0007, partial [uncultured bacterium (gcode 4)]